MVDNLWPITPSGIDVAVEPERSSGLVRLPSSKATIIARADRTQMPNKIQSRCMQMTVKQPYVERFELSNAQETRDDNAH